MSRSAGVSRRPDWLERLLAYVEGCRHQPHDIVGFNCALFAAGAIQAQTGADPVGQLGIRISSARDVAAVLDSRGGVRGLAAAFFGCEAFPPLLARRGDVVIKAGEDGETLGVCLGDHALFLADDGLQPRKLTECAGCWRVGEP